MSKKNVKVAKVRKHAVNAPTLEEVAVGLALASLYNEKEGAAVASRRTLAEITHYSEKRVRTTVRRMAENGRWTVTASGNRAKRFTPSV